MKKVFFWFRKIALAEGISYLLLLFIAMPLKYWADIPEAVSLTGTIHGVLFVAFMIWAILVKEVYKKSFLWVIIAFLASIIPFGTFVMEKRWKKEEELGGLSPKKASS